LRDEVQEKKGHQDAWDLDARPDNGRLRCAPQDTPVKVLSGGERRVASTRLLQSRTSCCSMNQLITSMQSRRVLSTLCRVMYDCDRSFTIDTSSTTSPVDSGAGPRRGIPYKGNYSSGWNKQEPASPGKIQRTTKTLQRELEWIRMSPKARHAKGEARINSYETLLQQESEKRREDLEIHIPAGPRLGDVVIEANEVSKAYGANLLVEGMTFALPPGGIVGVIGPNGAGKTTLFRMITKQEEPDSGAIRTGETVQLAYVDQSRTLDPEKSIWEEISGGSDTLKLGSREVNSRAYVARFNFSGSDQQKKVGVLSGGERNRVHLAKMLKEGANVLLLDEPTNDLDVNTLRALEEALESFAGCAVIISHDRWFLDRIATHMLAFEGDSKVVWFDGNYSEYEADRKNRLGAAADQPQPQVQATDAIGNCSRSRR
jgi:ATPase subunit of ABC transporter with duplicated ATPase domains